MLCASAGKDRPGKAFRLCVNLNPNMLVSRRRKKVGGKGQSMESEVFFRPTLLI